MSNSFVDVFGYEGLYQVNPLGQVKSLRMNKVMSPGVTNGYLFVILWKNKCHINHYIHRLVGKTFISNIENKEEINHKDSDRSNNIVSNLEWCTRKENIQHGHSQGNMYQQGEYNHMCKLSKQDVSEIRQLRLSGIRLKDIAKKYNVSESHICGICKNYYRKVE